MKQDPYDELDVFLNEQKIGKLSSINGEISFRYSPAYLEDVHAYPLSQNLPLRTEEFVGLATENFFSNLLPDERMRIVIAQVLGTSPENTFGLLKRIGADCAGAVSFYPSGEMPRSLREPILRVLTDAEAVEILERLGERPLDVGEEGVRISGAGSQEKLVFCLKDGKICLPLYGTPSTHIIKPAMVGFSDSVYNELFCMKLAKICKIPVAECSILHLGDEDLYVTERFDREVKEGVVQRLHQEDFCQILGVSPKLKYQEDGGPGIEDCLKKMLQMHMLGGERLQFIRLVLFNCLIGNCDAHAKNYGVLYREGRPSLAPAYDLLSTVVYENMNRCLAMKIGGENRLGQIGVGHFERMAEQCDLNPKMVLGELQGLASQLLEKANVLAEKLNALYPNPVYGRITWEMGKICRQIIC